MKIVQASDVTPYRVFAKQRSYLIACVPELLLSSAEKKQSWQLVIMLSSISTYMTGGVSDAQADSISQTILLLFGKDCSL
jgi:hypothetical protein